MSPDSPAACSKNQSKEKSSAKSRKRSKGYRRYATGVESKETEANDENCKWCCSETKSVHSFEWTIDNLADIVCDGSMPQTKVDVITSRRQSKWTVSLQPGDLPKNDGEETKVFVYDLYCHSLKPGVKSALVNIRWYVRTLGRCDLITEERALQFHPENIKKWTWSTPAAERSLTFRCDLQVSDEPSSETNDFADTLEGWLLSAFLSRFLNGNSSSDVVFDADGVAFKLHKDVLSAKSAEFADLFARLNNGERTEAITFATIQFSETTFAIVVRYLYTGEVPLMVHVPTLEDVWYGAYDWKIDGLRELCEYRLAKMIDRGNALDMLVFAELKGWSIFKSAAAKYVVNNLTAMKATRQWEDLFRDFPQIVLDILFRRIEFRKTLKIQKWKSFKRNKL